MAVDDFPLAVLAAVDVGDAQGKRLVRPHPRVGVAVQQWELGTRTADPVVLMFF
jgi:hypothetical protein